jgi:oligoribonuclease
MQNELNLIWIDLEMTGLNPDTDRILEIATIVTDQHLTILAEGPVLAVKQPDALLDGMDAWCTQQHTQSGLVARVRASHVTEAEAEVQTLEFLEQWQVEKKSPMCGNSICQDRRFLYRYMPTLEAFFHYRHIDVSTVKELARRWQPKIYQNLSKNSAHLALADIKESIDELKYYREHFFVKSETAN